MNAPWSPATVQRVDPLHTFRARVANGDQGAHQ